MRKIAFAVIVFLIGINQILAQLQTGHIPKKNADTKLEALRIDPSSPKMQQLKANSAIERTTFARANADSVQNFDRNSDRVKIAVIAPFDVRNAGWRIYGQINAKNEDEIVDNKLKESIREIFDFYEGFKYALQLNPPKFDLDIYTYDCGLGDSIIKVLLKNDTLKSCDIIIGPGTAFQSRLVSEFCKKYNIINVNPFVSARNISKDNPYMVRVVPTVEDHIQKQFSYITDSIKNPNIIVYAPKSDKCIPPAKYLIKLIEEYNSTADNKVAYSFINMLDTISKESKSVSAYTKSGKSNVLFSTSFDLLAGSNFLAANGGSCSYLMGMPSLLETPERLNGSLLRSGKFYFSDNAAVIDTSLNAINSFHYNYNKQYYHYPTEESYFGYDCINYLVLMIERYGKNFVTALPQEPYNGLANKFWFAEQRDTENNNAIDCYSNEALYIYKYVNGKKIKVKAY